MEESGATPAASLTRRRFVRQAATGVAGLTVLGAAAGCNGAAGARVNNKLKIPLANSFIGNTWRLEMENTYRAALGMEPYRSQVFGQVFNSENDMSDQAQQLSNLISSRVDAILIDAASPTGLNGVVGQAIDRGILVVSFDNIVTAPGALQVNTDQFKFGRELAQWLVRELHGKGNIIMVTGVPGTFVDTQRTAGGMSVFSKTPGIKVVNKYSGMWDSAVAQRNTAAVLPSLPKIDGIWAQGGTDGILKAFKAAGKPLPPTAGESENGFRLFMNGSKTGQKLPGFSIAQPPYLVLLALELARRVLRHEYPRKSLTVPFDTATTATVKPGVNVFPQLQDSFFTGITDLTPDRLVNVKLSEVVTGKPASSSINIRLPAA